MMTIWLGHLLLGMAYATVVVQARLQDLNPQLEEAAMDLGARPHQVFALVTLPMIAQSLLSAWLLTFTLSLDDVVLSAFCPAPRHHHAAGDLLARTPGAEPQRQCGGHRHRRHRGLARWRPATGSHAPNASAAKKWRPPRAPDTTP